MQPLLRGPRKPESIPHNSQAIHSVGLGAQGGRKIRNIPHTLPESSIPNTKPNLLTKSMLTGVGCRILDHLQVIPRRQTFMVEIISHPPRRQTEAMEHTPRKTRKARNSTLDETVSRITIGEPTLPCIPDSYKTVRKIQSTKRNTRGTGGGRNENVPTMNSIRRQNTAQNPKTAQGSNTRQTPIASRNPR